MNKTGVLRIIEDKCPQGGYWAWLKPSEKDQFIKMFLEKISIIEDSTKTNKNHIVYLIGENDMSMIKSKWFKDICGKSDTIIHFIKIEEGC